MKRKILKYLFAFVVLYFIFLPSKLFALTTITTCQELQNMNNDLTEDYLLGNDINCTSTNTWNETQVNEGPILPTADGTKDTFSFADLRLISGSITNVYLSNVLPVPPSLVAWFEVSVSQKERLTVVPRLPSPINPPTSVWPSTPPVE